MAGSPNLLLAQEIVYLWRVYALERYCLLTTCLLRSRDRFEQTVRCFIRDQTLSPYKEQLGEMFLISLCQDADRLAASVAQFELALTKVKRGDRREYLIAWEVDPLAVLENLLAGRPADQAAARGSYHILVARRLTNLFQVVPPEACEDRPEYRAGTTH